MYTDKQQHINDITDEVQNLFYGPSIENIHLIDLYQDDIKRMLFKASNSKFFKVLNKRLVIYTFHDYRFKHDNDYSPVAFVDYLLSTYVDYENKGNSVYRNIAQYIEKIYITNLDLSNDKILNYLIHCFHQALNKLHLSNKYAKDDIMEFRRLLEFLIAYLYINDELLGDDIYDIMNKKFFYDVLDILSADDYYESMKLNGALSQHDNELEDKAKMFYIEEAIKEAKNKVKEGEMV